MRLALLVILFAIAGSLAGYALAGPSPSPPTPRVAKLERQVHRLQIQLANTQALALGTAQQVQAGHDAFARVSEQVDNLTERVAWLEARVDKLEGK